MGVSRSPKPFKKGDARTKEMAKKGGEATKGIHKNLSRRWLQWIEEGIEDGVNRDLFIRETLMKQFKKGNTAAIDRLLDRALGKPKGADDQPQPTEHTVRIIFEGGDVKPRKA